MVETEKIPKEKCKECGKMVSKTTIVIQKTGAQNHVYRFGEMYVELHRRKCIKIGQPGINFQNEIDGMDVARDVMEEIVERRRGRRFIRWTFDRRMRENHTPSIMAKFRRHINTAFYIRYSDAYLLVKQ